MRHACYLINRVATRSLSSQTPYEVFKGRKSSVKHLKVFGCIGYVKADTQHLRKLDDRSRSLLHLGTEPGSKAYRMFDPTNKKAVVSRDVTFDESKSWKWSNEDHGIEDEPRQFQLTLGTFGNQGIGTEESIVDTTDGHGINSHEANDDTTEEPFIRRSTRVRKKPAYLDDYVLLSDDEAKRLLLLLNEEPWSYEEAIEEKVWRDVCQNEIESIIKNNTWDLVDLHEGAKAIGLKWIFKIKRNVDGSINKYKSRLVAKGHIQRHGVDFEEVFAHVARIETVRFIIALAASKGWEIHHLDVKTAFLHGDLKEDAYACQPEGLK